MAISPKLKCFTIPAIALASVIGMAPLYGLADDDHDDRDRYSWSHRNPVKNYSAEELRVLAEANALKRYGPGSTATITSDQERGTHWIQLRDSEGNILRETEVNLSGKAVRPTDEE